MFYPFGGARDLWEVGPVPGTLSRCRTSTAKLVGTFYERSRDSRGRLGNEIRGGFLATAEAVRDVHVAEDHEALRAEWNELRTRIP